MLLPSIVQAALLGSLASASPLLRRGADVDSSVGDPHTGPALAKDYVGPATTGGAWSKGYEKAKAIVEQMTLAELTNVTTGLVDLLFPLCALVQLVADTSNRFFVLRYPGPCSGNTGAVPRLGLKSRCFEDGPLGVRPTDYVSQFPAGVTIAATWDHDLFYQRANAIGQEFHDKGVHLALGPVTGGPLGRSPLAGRNWEGGSPDNYLNGVLSKIGVKGLQDAGVQGMLTRHLAFCGVLRLITSLFQPPPSTSSFVSLIACKAGSHKLTAWCDSQAYEQETYRSYYLPSTTNDTARNQQIDSYLDDTTMHELYLTSFAEAVRAGAASVMCSYNSVNGIHACGNNYTLNGLLKSELGFQGYVVSDWGGTWATTDSIAGLDTTMPGSGYGGFLGDLFGTKLANLSDAGGVEMARLQDMAIRSLLPYYQMDQDSSDYPEVSYDMASLGDGLIPGQFVVNKHLNVQKDHYKVIRTIGETSATLLKNIVTGGKGLPITANTTRIGIFGQDATYQTAGLTGCGGFGDCTLSTAFGAVGAGPNGTQSSGGGSGTALAPYVYTPLEAITARGRRTGLKVDYELNDSNDTLPLVTITAGNVQKAVVFVAAFQSEGIDRADLQLDNNGVALILTVAAVCTDTIVVIHSGQQVDMEAFADHPNITSIIFGYYPGQETGAAIDSVLFGDVSPSGKLPWTVGKLLEDYPSGAGSIVRADVATPNANFTEGVFIDYKWFDAKNITPRYEFGFGLSYSTFKFSDATVKSDYAADSDYVQKTNEVLSGGGDLYDQLYTVGVTVENTGDIVAAEVAQVYLTFPSNVTNQPIRLLRGFCKETYNAGESKTLTFPLRAKDMAIWMTEAQEWAIPKGEFTFSIGSSSRNHPVSVKLTV
ncbi:beta-glucosidase, partial [Phenoliferia sp. Uapishka_3]